MQREAEVREGRGRALCLIGKGQPVPRGAQVRAGSPGLESVLLSGLDTEVQWVFDRSGAHGALPSGAQYLVVSLSAADAYLPLGAEALVARFTTELGRLLPAMAGARLLDGFVTREPRATFRPAPGSAAHRPAAETTLPALALAGAWTDTGWPATMEGAVRSGETAAAVVSRTVDRARVAA